MLALLLAATLALPLGLLISILALAAMFSLATGLGQVLKQLRRRHYRQLPLPPAWALGHNDVPTSYLFRSQRKGPLHAGAVVRLERRLKPTIDWSLPRAS